VSRRRRRQLARRATYTAAAAGSIYGYDAWTNHHDQTVAALQTAATFAAVSLAVAAVIAAAVSLAVWRHRAAQTAAAVAAEPYCPTDVYRHYFSNGRILYVGKSVAYNLRCVQHAEESWWWYYVDPTRSEKQTYRTEEAALRAEATLIRELKPIGNYQHNPNYRKQHPERLALMAEASRHRAYAQPPPAITTAWSPPRARARQRAFGGVR
jgi:hypothetical protein